MLPCISLQPYVHTQLMQGCSIAAKSMLPAGCNCAHAADGFCSSGMSIMARLLWPSFIRFCAHQQIQKDNLYHSGA